ncbi:MAG: 4-phosphoerythronate dehydrogenase [Ignavibacteria bacterium]|nr:4-phosphoerythronate dehydrogenase [Ignavibacteria bacterium]
MIVVDSNIQHASDLLGDVNEVVECDSRNITNAFLKSQNAEAVFVRSPTKINQELLHGTIVSFVGSATAGTDHIDFDYLNNNNIAFAHAPGSNANAVAEYVVCTILAHTPDPSNLVCGIVGFGHIGSKVAHYANALGMTVLVNDPLLLDVHHSFPSYCTVCSLDEVMSAGHIVTLHIPYTTTGDHPTHQLITEQMLWRLNPNALFINTSRGGIVNEDVLLTRHSMQRITAALDVYNNEPNINPAIVKSIQHCTPHIAGYTANAKLNGALAVVNAYLLSKGLSSTHGSEQFNSDQSTPHLNTSNPDLPIGFEPRSPLEKYSIEELRTVLNVRRPIMDDAEYFRKRWLDDPTVLTFDACRSGYLLRMETLTTS